MINGLALTQNERNWPDCGHGLAFTNLGLPGKVCPAGDAKASGSGR